MHSNGAPYMPDGCRTAARAGMRIVVDPSWGSVRLRPVCRVARYDARVRSAAYHDPIHHLLDPVDRTYAILDPDQRGRVAHTAM
jgi:hypothetical protein